jgi:hypothetical protein
MVPSHFFDYPDEIRISFGNSTLDIRFFMIDGVFESFKQIEIEFFNGEEGYNKIIEREKFAEELQEEYYVKSERFGPFFLGKGDYWRYPANGILEKFRKRILNNIQKYKDAGIFPTENW